MRISTSSPGASGQKRGPMSVGPDNPRRRTAGDARGLSDAGAGSKGPAEKLSNESEGRRRRPSLIHRLRISVRSES